MLQGKHIAIISTCIRLSSLFKTFVLSFFVRPLKTDFTVSPTQAVGTSEQLENVGCRCAAYDCNRP